MCDATTCRKRKPTRWQRTLEIPRDVWEDLRRFVKFLIYGRPKRCLEPVEIGKHIYWIDCPESMCFEVWFEMTKIYVIRYNSLADKQRSFAGARGAVMGFMDKFDNFPGEAYEV